MMMSVPGGDGLLGLVLVGLWAYCVFDVAITEPSAVRHLPKGAWLLIVVLIPDVGAIAWLAFGRPTREARARRADVERPRLAPRARPRARSEEDDIVAHIEERDRLLAKWRDEDAARDAEDSAP